ncbi:MAG: hypothetical protein OXR68_04115 [Alphaproteobacteria bacterium]|nr:hypothetical protein [Alphaproteobacteria bacterium]MDD9919792.1 hypothetical protein [Alphaproteobacteria bacterium]
MTTNIIKTSPAENYTPITPSDGVDLAVKPRGLAVQGTGDVVLVGENGTEATFFMVAGLPYPYSPTRVKETGTTATGIVGLN